MVGREGRGREKATKIRKKDLQFLPSGFAFKIFSLK